MNRETPKKLCPGREFSAYTFVPGEQPHPCNDGEGHSYGTPESNPEPLNQGAWRESEEYLYGIDLFNFGYYWEAHEVWEGLWHAASHTGVMAGFLKGLIKLAAAGVKIRQQNTHGIRKHATDAREFFSEIGESRDIFAGMNMVSLINFAKWIQNEAGELPPVRNEPVTSVFPELLPLVKY